MTLTLLLAMLAAACPAQSGYYRDDYGRAYYLDSYGTRHYLRDAYLDRYGYRYYIDQHGYRRYLYDGELIGAFTYETRRADFDLGRVGGLGRIETEATFKAIWAAFRKNFILTDKGSFEESAGASTPDNEETRAAFLRFVSEQTPEVTLPFTDKCSRCDGDGLKVGLVGSSGYYSRHMQTAGQKLCDACNGSGGAKGVIVYRLIYNPKAPAVAPSAAAATPKAAQPTSKETLALAEQGDANAQFQMGEYFWKQDGREKDPSAAQALKWYRASLLAGNSDAAERLIQIHTLPHPVLKPDVGFARALQRLYPITATATDSASSLPHSSSLIDGIEAAVIAERIAQMKSSSEASTVSQCLDPKQVRTSFSVEQPDLLARCKSGDADALCRLGLCYATGLGMTSRNSSVAAIWLEQAACKGNAEAFYILGALYEDGAGYPRNPTAAHALYTVSAKLFSPKWSPWERATGLAQSINQEASAKASAAILGQLKDSKLTVDAIQELAKLPPRLKPAAPPAQVQAAADDPGAGPAQGEAYASGFVFTKQGHLFTSANAVKGARAIYIVKGGGGGAEQRLEAKVVRIDLPNNLAILQCPEWTPPEGAPDAPPPITPSKYCRLGDPLFSLGYIPPAPGGAALKYQKGDLTDLNGPQGDSSRLQHTLSVPTGNSGGPLCLMDGRIVGMAEAGGEAAHLSIKSDYMLTLAQMADIEIPISMIDGPPVEHVKGYTVQILCER